MLLMAPAAKFLMGCAAFLIQVILNAWNKCQHSDVDRLIGLVVGIMSMGMVVMTALFLVYDAKFGGMPSSQVAPAREGP